MLAGGTYICGPCKVIISECAVQEDTQQMHCISRPGELCRRISYSPLTCLRMGVSNSKAVFTAS